LRAGTDEYKPPSNMDFNSFIEVHPPPLWLSFCPLQTLKSWLCTCLFSHHHRPPNPLGSRGQLLPLLCPRCRQPRSKRPRNIPAVGADLPPPPPPPRPLGSWDLTRPQCLRMTRRTRRMGARIRMGNTLNTTAAAGTMTMMRMTRRRRKIPRPGLRSWWNLEHRYEDFFFFCLGILSLSPPRRLISRLWIPMSSRR